MRTLLIALFAVFTFVACDKDDGTKKPDPEDMGEPLLNGEWVSECLSNSTAYSGPLGEKRLVTVKGGQTTTKYILFRDENCSDAQAQLTLVKRSQVTTSNLSKGGENTGFFSVDDTASSYTIIPANPDYADVLSRSEFCGIKKWQSGREYNVTGRKCPQSVPFPAVTKYTILKLDQSANPDTFALGRYSNAENGNSPQSRPKTVTGDLHHKISD